MKYILFSILLLTSFSGFGGNEHGGNHQQFMRIESDIYKDLDTRTRLRESVGLEPRTKIPGTDIDAIRNNDDLFTDPTNFLILPKSNNP